MQVFYAVTDGFYWTLEGWQQLVLSEAAGASTEVQAGDVIIRNAPVFLDTSTPVARVAVEVYLPSGYLWMKFITKLRSVSATVRYNALVREWWLEIQSKSRMDKSCPLLIFNRFRA
jgi:hypothetical protein